MSEIWTVRRVLGWTAQHFEKREIDAPRLTAELLLAHVLHFDRVRLYIELDRPLAKEELAAYRALIERRSAGEPTQYLTGVKEFYGRSFRVDARVLVPRPETELLVELALRGLPKDGPSKALDLCTGSGCIAVTIAAERPQCVVTATDLSDDACAVARHNAETLGVLDRVSILLGDLDAPVAPGESFDVVISNPPYIRSDEIETLSAEVRREPRLALDGGADGLTLVRRVLKAARARLRPGGVVALEIGEAQGSATLSLLAEEGFIEPKIEKDLARFDRLAFALQP